MFLCLSSKTNSNLSLKLKLVHWLRVPLDRPNIAIFQTGTDIPSFIGHKGNTKVRILLHLTLVSATYCNRTHWPKVDTIILPPKCGIMEKEHETVFCMQSGGCLAHKTLWRCFKNAQDLPICIKGLLNACSVKYKNKGKCWFNEELQCLSFETQIWQDSESA